MTEQVEFTAEQKTMLEEIKAMEQSTEKLQAIYEHFPGTYYEIIRDTERARAEAIKTEHLLYEQSIKKGLAHAQRAGELLVEVKNSLKHGEFSDWVLYNCSFSMRTAQNYMRFYTQRKVLAKEFAKAQETAYLTEGELTMEQALQYLKGDRIKRIAKNKNTAELNEFEREPFLKQDKAIYRFEKHLKDFSKKVVTAQQALDYGKCSPGWVEFTLRTNKELIQKLNEFNENLENQLEEVKP